MRGRRRTKTAWVYAACVGAFAAAASLGACGGDDVFVPPPDAGADARVDGTAGDAARVDAGIDGATTDSGVVCLGSGDAALDGAAAQSGMQLVLQLGCAGCHQGTPADAGLTLSGRNDSLSDGGAVYPPNLTPDPATGLGCFTDAQIVNAILNAEGDDDAGLCSMPRFASYGLDAGAAADIVEFLRSLPLVVNAVPATTCPTPPADAGLDATIPSDADTDAAGDVDANVDGADAADAAAD